MKMLSLTVLADDPVVVQRTYERLRDAMTDIDQAVDYVTLSVTETDADDLGDAI